MTIHRIFIINKAGSLIYHYDNWEDNYVEISFSYPLTICLKEEGNSVIIDFGIKDVIERGYLLIEINGEKINNLRFGEQLILPYLNEPSHFPLKLKFLIPKLRANEKIMLASMFHSLYAIVLQLAPEKKCAGIDCIETDSFNLYCYQTLTGIKFLIIVDTKQIYCENILRKLYEIYSDYALKNPFYSLEMPIRCELFDQHIKILLDQSDHV